MSERVSMGVCERMSESEFVGEREIGRESAFERVLVCECACLER